MGAFFKSLFVKFLLLISTIRNKNTGIPILEYHRVSDKISGKDVHSVYVQDFQWQMKYLFENNYNVISLQDFYDNVNNKNVLPEKSIIITFDDGHRDNIYYAAPILRQYNFKAIMFIVSNYVGKKGWLDVNGNLLEHETDKSQWWDLLSWQELKSLQDCYILESHCHSHKKLTMINDLTLIDELKAPKKYLFDKLGINSKYFCYPYGIYSEYVIDFTLKEGYLGAVTIEKGTNKPGNLNFYKLKRNEVGRGIDLNSFKLLLLDESKLYFQVSNYFNIIRRFVTRFILKK